MLLICVSVLFFNTLYAQDAGLNINGDTWRKMTEQEKIFYLSGYYKGLSLAKTLLAKDSLEKTQLLEKYCPDKLNVRTGVISLDKFYEDYSNRTLVVSEALSIIKMQETGQSKEAIERELSRIAKIHAEVNR
jgi:hypothetical protein